MRLEGLLQLNVCRLVDHRGQRLGNLLFGRQERLQLVEVQLAKIVEIRGKHLHNQAPGGRIAACWRSSFRLSLLFFVMPKSARNAGCSMVESPHNPVAPHLRIQWQF
jgi:hypothetical protein